jgi:hypothetical protein
MTACSSLGVVLGEQQATGLLPNAPVDMMYRMLQI